jgi:hypothetical protein
VSTAKSNWAITHLILQKAPDILALVLNGGVHVDNNRVTRLEEGKVEKDPVEHRGAVKPKAPRSIAMDGAISAVENRGRFKPKAPANLVLPKPVPVPAPPSQNNQTAPKN